MIYQIYFYNLFRLLTFFTCIIKGRTGWSERKVAKLSVCSDLTYREWREKGIEAGIAFICRRNILLSDRPTDHDEPPPSLPFGRLIV